MSLFETGPSGEYVGLGSGTLVRTAQGRAAVLTAAHVVEGGRSVNILAATGVALDVIADVRTLARELDIALLETRPSAASLDELAIDSTLIVDDHTPLVKKGDTLVAIGFPEQVTTTVYNHARRLAQRRIGDMIYSTMVAGSDRTALSLMWTEAEVSEPHLYEAAGFPCSGLFNQKKPRGISGGAVWKQLRGDSIEIWTVEAGFRMVGVLYEFTNRKQLAVPAKCWSAWLRQQLATL